MIMDCWLLSLIPAGVSITLSRKRIFYSAGSLAALVMVASWWWWGIREMNYVNFSRTPLPQVGQVVPHATKGIVVYITSEDARFDILLIRICIGSGIVTAFCLAISGELSKMLNPKPSAPPEL
jgi:hypothetical protein